MTGVGGKHRSCFGHMQTSVALILIQKWGPFLMDPYCVVLSSGEGSVSVINPEFFHLFSKKILLRTGKIL